MSAAQFIKLKAAVGKNAPNFPEDVMTVQSRLNHWILKSLLPGIDFLAVDGDCGPKTRDAIGAFQYLYLGHRNPDCRVDPGGQTLYRMFESLLNPQRTFEEFAREWIQKKLEPKPGPKPAVWHVSAADEERIRKAWGEELAAWAKEAPLDGIPDAKEFAPPWFLRESYETVFAWKCNNPRLKCGAKPNEMLQVLGMLRSDRAYWERRMKGNRVGVEMLTTSSASAIRDYREFIVQRKLCPPAARLRLEQISKDTIYQMFLGMFQMLSPVGVPSAYAPNTEKLAEFIHQLVQMAHEAGQKAGK